MIIGSSHTSSRPPSLAKRVSCSCEVQTGLIYMKKKGSVPFVKQDLWLHSVIMLLHVMGDVFSTRPPKRQNFFRLQRCQPVTSLRAEKPDTRNKFSTWRCVFTLLVCWAIGSSGYNHYLPTASQYFFKCG